MSAFIHFATVCGWKGTWCNSWKFRNQLCRILHPRFIRVSLKKTFKQVVTRHLHVLFYQFRLGCGNVTSIQQYTCENLSNFEKCLWLAAWEVRAIFECKRPEAGASKRFNNVKNVNASMLPWKMFRGCNHLAEKSEEVATTTPHRWDKHAHDTQFVTPQLWSLF